MMDLVDPKNGSKTDDMRLLQLIRKEISMVNGNYQIPLPLKDVNVNFSNNQKKTLRNLKIYRKKLLVSETYLRIANISWSI